MNKTGNSDRAVRICRSLASREGEPKRVDDEEAASIAAGNTSNSNQDGPCNVLGCDCISWQFGCTCDGHTHALALNLD